MTVTCNWLMAFFLSLCSLTASMQWAQASDSASSTRVQIETELGAFTVQVFLHKAPQSAAHFLEMIDLGHYQDATFYRANRPDNSPAIEAKPDRVFALSEGGVIQGGLGYIKSANMPTVDHESTEQTGLRHQQGSVSFARMVDNDATSEIFITLGEQAHFDAGGEASPDGRGYAVFGQVIQGMDVVEQILQQQTFGRVPRGLVWQTYKLDKQLREEDWELIKKADIVEPVKIRKAYRLP